MSVESRRKDVPWLLVTGFLLLGAGYLLGRGGVLLGRPLSTRERPPEPRGEAGEPERDQGPAGHQPVAVAPRRSERAASGRGQEGVIRFDAESLELANLRVETVGYRSVHSRLAVTGAVEPNLGGVVRVTPRVAGKVQSIRANVGDTIAAGQTLATLASTELAQAQAAYRQAVARVAVARENLQRQRELARLGSFGRPAIEASQTQAATAQSEIETSQSEVAAAQAGVAEAESQVRALQAALAQAETQVQVTESRFKRADSLLKEEIVSRQDWEQAWAEYQRSRADVDAARANIAQGQAKAETAQANLAAARSRLTAARKRGEIASQALAREEAVYRGRFMTSKELVEAEAVWRQAQLDRRAAAESIRLLGGTAGGGNVVAVTAPLGGRVTERLVTLGETVTPDKTLFTIINLHTVWVQLNVYQKDLSSVHLGESVTVTSDTAPGRTFAGGVSSIGDVVDEATRTVKLRAVIQNPGNVLKPQSFVRGAIVTSARATALMVPADAVQQLEGRSVVFVPAGRRGELRARPVAVGAKLDGWVEIRSGLKAGDRVVTRNAFLVKSQAIKGQLGEEEEGEQGGR